MNSNMSELTTEDIRKYLQRICEEAEGMMRDYDPQVVLDWTDTNLIDSTCFQVDIRVQKDGVHTGSIAMTLTKQDIEQWGGLFGAAVGKGGIDDYSVQMELHDVVPHGADAATARVTWREHIVMQTLAADGQAAGGKLTVDAEANCVHLVVRDHDRLALGMALCTGTVRFTLTG